MLATQLPGGSAHAEEDINIGVGELQECSISKSTDGTVIVYTGLDVPGIRSSDLADWQANYGTGASATGDGDSDGRDFLLWQRSYGSAGQ